MIRLVMGDDDAERKLLIIGIDDVNIEKLTAGQPLLSKGEQVGLDVDVLVVHGHTLEDVARELREKYKIDVPEVMPVPPPSNERH